MRPLWSTFLTLSLASCVFAAPKPRTWRGRESRPPSVPVPALEGDRAGAEKAATVKLLVFDDPALQRSYEWLVDEADVHDAMRALARQAYRRNRRELPDEMVEDQLRAHGRIDARPYLPPAAS